MALKLYGGVTRTKIPLEIPEDDAKLSELELVFNQEHSRTGKTDLEQEAAELLQRYKTESRKQEIQALSAKLASIEDDDDDSETILRRIRDLQNQSE